VTAEHERQCERTIASVVHEIDDLNHQLRDASSEIERLASASGFALGQARNVIDMYRHLVMDTPKDQALHTKVVAAADTAIDTALAVLTARATVRPEGS
jgi:multidrug resistance efflux pump